MSDSQLDKVCDRANKTRPLLIGSYAPYLNLPDSTQKKWIAFYDLDAEYKILYFWDPDCGHCKKELPKLAHYVDSVKSEIDVKVYSVSSDHNSA